MRVRAEDTFCTEARLRGEMVKVFVDGNEVADVFAADTVEGWADVVDRDAEGRVQWAGDEAKIKRLFGSVEIKTVPFPESAGAR